MKDWQLIYEGFDPKTEKLREALCTLGNGYFATRAAAPESGANDTHYPGTYLAGGYNRLKTEIAGREVGNEDLVNLPNWLCLSFRYGKGDWFDLEHADLLDYRQELNLRQGVLTRSFRFRDSDGRRTAVVHRCLVSMAEPHLAALQTTITPENWSGRLQLRSALDGRVRNDGVQRYRDLNNQHLVPLESGALPGNRIHLKVTMNQSDLRVAQAARTRLFASGRLLDLKPEIEHEADYVAQHFKVDVTAGQNVTIEKVAALFTSRDHAIAECGLAAREAVAQADGFAGLQQQHELAWKRLWNRFEIQLEYDASPETQHQTSLILHLHVFHLLQTTSPHSIDLDTGVPSRGWHGEAYRGHIFWDEMFVFPLLNLRAPDITRALLIYRYRRLNAARRAAEEAGHQGAMYPWQSGSDGREESQEVHLNPKSGRWLPDHSRLQRHVNIAIAYNIWQYYQVTADLEFLCYYGAEMLLEIARFWSSLTTFNEKLDRYEILGVMGPDEYHEQYPDADEPGLNNNTYTNVMVVWLLCRALELLQRLPKERRLGIREKLALSDEELQRWEDISRRMRVVFHGDDDKILSQFEGYEKLEELDWPKYRQEHGNVMRLDRILEAEDDSPNRYQASKQADVLMLFYLLSRQELEQLFQRLGYPFDRDLITRNIEYYQPRTSHGSTLSQVVHAWILSRSDRKRSWKLFAQALKSDFEDVQGGTTPEGIHLGAMAGTVDIVQRCFTGIEMRDNVLWFNPRLPDEINRLRLRLSYRQASLKLEVTHEALSIEAVHCPIEPILIGFGDRVLSLKEGEELDLKLEDRRQAHEPSALQMAGCN